MRFPIAEYIEKGYLEPIDGGYFVKKETPNDIKKELSISDDEYFETFGERMFFFSKKNTEMAKDSLWSKIKRVVSDLNPWPRQEGGLFGYAPVDLSDVFDKKPTEKDVEDYLNGLLEPMETGTPPLKIQITNEKRPHVIDNGMKLRPTQQNRKFSALMKIEDIISKSKKIDRDGTVDLSHNSERTRKRKEESVLEYVYFICPLKIKGDDFSVEMATERIKGQDPDILDLYNFRVKTGVLQ